MPPPLSPELIRDFRESMPARYRQRYDTKTVAQHARIASERGKAPVTVGNFFGNSSPGASICVVADDRPGLLATISAAFVLSGLDVISAEAYTRKSRAGRREAVDLFWVRRGPDEQRKSALDARELDSFKDHLIALLDGKLDPSRATPTATAEFSSSQTVVRFLEGNDGELTTLEVETHDRSGLLLTLSQALYQQRVQIVASEVRTDGDRVLDRFDIVELDGSAISPGRRLDIQVAVISAVQPPFAPEPDDSSPELLRSEAD
jgi:[protein-PII] uridylyltransferase